MSEIRSREVEDLLRVFAALDDPDDIYNLMVDSFTIREIRDISHRLAVARMLNEGQSYSAIAERTGASATTIARVSKCIGYGAGGYAKAISILDHGGQ